MKKYDPLNFTWGFELELGDVSKSIEIPKHLGEWEYNETDIVNIREPYFGVAVDPLGIEPPVGGEINVKPTKTRDQQVTRIREIFDLFRSYNQEPTATFISNNHFHIRIQGLNQDLESIKRLTRYIQHNQKILIDRCTQFKIDPQMTMFKEWDHLKKISPISIEYLDKTYLKSNNALPLPDFVCDAIYKAKTFEQFYQAFPWNERKLPIRYGINLFCLQFFSTVEFRFFWASTNLREIADSMLIAERFLDAGLNGGPDIEQLLEEYDYHFTPFEYNHQLYESWVKTKYQPLTRGKGKQRKFYNV